MNKTRYVLEDAILESYFWQFKLKVKLKSNGCLVDMVSLI
jgi:hypothetical protein